MATFDAIPNAEIAIDTAVKSSTAAKLRDNPTAALEGDATAQSAGAGLFIEKDPGDGLQTGIITDDTDTNKVLTPDGSGNAQWSAGFKPALILVERKEISAAVSSVSFTGLDGDTDEVYKLIARIIKPVGISTYSFRPNGLATNQAIGVVSNGTFATSANLDFLTTNAVANNLVTFECLIHARDVVQSIAMARQFLGKAVESSPPASVIVKVNDFGGHWTAGGNITSLDINSSLALGIGVGSTFELFKLAQT